jgi:hypothetical protein
MIESKVKNRARDLGVKSGGSYVLKKKKKEMK